MRIAPMHQSQVAGITCLSVSQEKDKFDAWASEQCQCAVWKCRYNFLKLKWLASWEQLSVMLCNAQHTEFITLVGRRSTWHDESLQITAKVMKMSVDFQAKHTFFSGEVVCLVLNLCCLKENINSPTCLVLLTCFVPNLLLLQETYFWGETNSYY